MARRKSSRKTPVRRRKSAGGGRTWPWVLSLLAVGGAIYAHDHQPQLERNFAGYFGKPAARHQQVAVDASKPKPIWRPPGGVDRATVAAISPARAKPVTPAPAATNAAYIPPAAVGVPEKRPLTASLASAGQAINGRSFTNTFYYCGTSGLDNCVASGDTLWFHKQKIVLADVTAPAMEQAKCQQERDLGFAAKVRLRELLNAGRFELATTDGAATAGAARLVMRNGRSVGAVLASEGLAHPRGAAAGWCP
ncbi:nuclease [Rhizobium halophytocola]|uniref:Endonuclease YncB(Thermonuclease family) n=1 Tax=Rhizobium halophytocola TaxID=735519 RepID=A0ABS4DWA3_9HYPH|nr:nuclease [Rhizobium halophytocola]MBP1849919.1 endonuclease YncB(thermonuclease family) [Rhizobium halophytocola]